MTAIEWVAYSCAALSVTIAGLVAWRNYVHERRAQDRRVRLHDGIKPCSPTKSSP